MTGLYIFLGVTAGVLMIGGIAYLAVRRKVKRFARQNFGTSDLSYLMRAAQDAAQDESLDGPKSLSGGDSIFMPRILRDFPDFNLERAKSLARAELTGKLSGKPELKIHKIILHDYQRAANEKTILFQSALQYKEDGHVRQKRYCLHYAYLLPEKAGTTAAGSCPHCGAPFTSTTQTNCPYCCSLVANVLSNTWKFTDCYEA